LSEKGWSREFDEPIDLPRGRQVVMLQDAGNYITKLPKTEHMAPEWQAADMAQRQRRSMNAEIVNALAHQFARFGPGKPLPAGISRS
jgi:hypothetical protein